MTRKLILVVALAIALTSCASLTPVQEADVAAACTGADNVVQAITPLQALLSPEEQAKAAAAEAAIQASCNPIPTTPEGVVAAVLAIAEAIKDLKEVQAAHAK
jgi:hypothetical protein